MAFMGRGGFPSIENDNIGDVQDNKNGQGYGYYRRYGYHGRLYYYIPLDNTYVIMQMILTFIILIVGVITFFAIYKSTIIDPIESTKKLFMNSYLVILGIVLAMILINNFFSKSERALIKGLVIISSISIVIMLVFFGIKLNLDTTYTKEKFEQFYTEQNIDESSNNITKSKIDIGIGGMSIKTQKEYYIDECSKLYTIFSAKAYAILGLHFLLNILFVCQILKTLKMQEKRDKLNKDDLVLFDEEENVKI